MTVDLSTLPEPIAIETLDGEQIIAELMEDVATRFEAVGVNYNVGHLEYDPVKIVMEAFAARELQLRARINDAVKAVLVAYSSGSNLDALAATFGVTRLSGEGDVEFKQRLLLAPESYSSAGTPGAYIYHARTVSPLIKDVGLEVPTPGQVIVYLLSFSGLEPLGDEVVQGVRAVMCRDEIRPLTDAITVVQAETVNYAVTLTITVPDGPDPDVVKTAAIQSLSQFVSDQFLVGRTVHLSGITAAAHVPNVKNVVIQEPAGDVIIGVGQAGWCSDLIVDVVVES